MWTLERYVSWVPTNPVFRFEICSSVKMLNDHLFNHLNFVLEITVRSRAHDVQEDWKPTFLSNEEFIYLVLEALEGFVMVFSATGQIFYVSESITSLLGHNPVSFIFLFILLNENKLPSNKLYFIYLLCWMLTSHCYIFAGWYSEQKHIWLDLWRRSAEFIQSIAEPWKRSRPNAHSSRERYV